MSEEVKKMVLKEIEYHLERVKMLIYKARIDDKIPADWGYRSQMLLPTAYPSGKDMVTMEFRSKEVDSKYHSIAYDY